MGSSKKYDLFIGHGWRRCEAYDRFVEILDTAKDFDWENYSVLDCDPIIDPESAEGKKILLEEVKKQIAPAKCILITSEMYALFPDWIQMEIDIATEMDRVSDYDRLIIGISPADSRGIPKEIQQVADVLVSWDVQDIVKAIKLYSL